MKKRFIFIIFFIISVEFIFSKEKIIYPKSYPYFLLKERINTWIAKLDDNKNNKYFKNIIKIGDLAYPSIKERIKKVNWKTKRKLIKILGILKIKESKYILLNYLKNEKENIRVREECAIELRNFNGKEVYKTLLKFAFSSDSMIYRACCYSLLSYSNFKSIPYLIELLKHWDSEIKNKALLKLVKITQKSKLSTYKEWKNWWNDYKELAQE